MPRTTTLEPAGCPPIRALTTDELGLIKVVVSRGDRSFPKVVETWGAPDASRHVLRASLADRWNDPLLAVARKNKTIELLNPLNGDVVACENVSELVSDSSNVQDGTVAALHLFKSREVEERSNKLLMCTEKGKAILRSIQIDGGQKNSTHAHSLNSWDVCKAGSIICSAVDGLEKHALFAGKGVEINLWDLGSCNKIWTSRPPLPDSLELVPPTFFTAATFLCKDDHRKIAAGTNDHQIRLYDISAKRRSVISIDFRETSIRAIAEDFDGYKIYAGTGRGDLATFDMRTGKLLGCFIGKCSGSIRSIARHAELPVLVSCGLDRYLRFWDINTRKLLSAVFLKQMLSDVVIDTSFRDSETIGSSHVASASVGKINLDNQEDEDADMNNLEKPDGERESKKKRKKKVRNIKSTKRVEHDIKNMDQITPSHEKDATEKSKSKKKKKKKKVCQADDRLA